MKAATNEFIAMLPYFQEIQKKWLGLNFADIKIVFCKSDAMIFPVVPDLADFSFREKRTDARDPFSFETYEVELEKLISETGAIRVGYNERLKILLVKQ